MTAPPTKWQTASKRPSFVKKWLDGESSDHSTDLRDLLLHPEGLPESRISSSSFSSFSFLSDEDIPPPPEALRETSSQFDAWDMTSTDNLSPDEIQAIMIALTAADHQTAEPSTMVPPTKQQTQTPQSVTVPPPMCPRNVSVQQLPSVGGPEFLVTIGSGADTSLPTKELTQEDVKWLTGEIAKPTLVARQYSIQPAQSPRQSPERSFGGRRSSPPIKMMRQASVQPLPARASCPNGSSYWVTLPTTGAAVWKVNKNPDPVVRQVSLQRRRPSLGGRGAGTEQPLRRGSSSSSSKISFFRPTSRMNGKDLAFLVGPPRR